MVILWMHYWMSEYIIPLSLNNKSSQHLVTWNIYFISFIVSGIRSLWWDWLLTLDPEAINWGNRFLSQDGCFTHISGSQSSLVSVCVCMCVYVYTCVSQPRSLSQPLCTGISSFSESPLVVTSLQFRVIAFHNSWLPRRCTQNTSVPKSLGRICEAVCDAAPDS